MQTQQLHSWAGAAPLRSLGQDDAKPPMEAKLPEITERDILKLQAEAARQQIQTHRHTRIWTAIGGLVSVGTLWVAIRALRGK